MGERAQALGGGRRTGRSSTIGKADAKKSAKADARDVFIFFIAGAKERNPAAAQALIERLKG